jgi:predicted nucleic acid-binding protein
MKAAAIKRLVLDASLAVAWCFEDESSPLAEHVLELVSAGTEALAPAIWPLEVANALLVAERRKRITMAQVTALLQRISKLPIVVEPIPPARAFEQVLSVARQHELTEYDAAYVELALREAVPLATLDAKLRRAARAAGIVLIE